jgi:NAD(P)-dependent dehydrogenase (short-subunit alcohol dehydrogenase family)
MQPIALITGASRGIGAATALLAAQHGYAVAVNYSSNSLAADEVVRQIRAGGGTAITVQADVAVESQVMWPCSTRSMPSWGRCRAWSTTPA